jgi:NitT/TauT family transport system substrate-binding protein
MEILSEKLCQRGSRRRFLSGASALGAASLFAPFRASAAEPPPETNRIRLVKNPAICLAPEYVAEELLRLEGFSQIEYAEIQTLDAGTMLDENRADVTVQSAPDFLPFVEAGTRVVALAGIHGGCYELFANQRVRAIRDLKGKRVAVIRKGYSPEYFYVSSMVAYVGMDPRKDIEWIEGLTFDATMQLFVDGKADAFLGFPPQPQYLREQKVGRIIVNTAKDRPWDQYYCCMIGARPEFVKSYPIATKRAVRAILKATDMCARDPERAARYIVAKGYEPRYEIALDVLKSLSYDRWRTHDPEDSLRFFGVRLHEAGLIKTNPQTLISRSTDWRFLNELKKELKA